MLNYTCCHVAQCSQPISLVSLIRRRLRLLWEVAGTGSVACVTQQTGFVKCEAQRTEAVSVVGYIRHRLLQAQALCAFETADTVCIVCVTQERCAVGHAGQHNQAVSDA